MFDEVRSGGGELPNLEQQRKRAKELLRAHRRGERAAAQRMGRHLPRAKSTAPADLLAGRFTLSEAQLIVAREEGFASWPRMKHAVEAATASRGEGLDRLLEAAVSGSLPRVRALAEAAAGQDSLHVACALGDDATVARLLRLGVDATAAGGPHGWTPLSYLCTVQVARDMPETRAARVSIARRLLAAGADACDTTRDPRLIQGRRSVLAGALAYVRSAELARVLLEAGAAQSEDLWRMAILADAARLEGVEAMKLLLPLGPAAWELNGALVEVLAREDSAKVRLLLEAGADPNASGVWGRVGTTLHQAILAGRGRATLEALLDAGADLSRGDRDDRTAYAVAVRTGHAVAIELLRARGASDAELGPADRWIAACVTERADELRALSAEGPAPVWSRTDHQMLSWALRTRRLPAARLLLEAGLDPSVPDDDGQLPLGLAVKASDLELVERLLAAGAAIDARDLDDRSALDRALELPDGELRGRLVGALLDLGADASDARGFPTGDDALDTALRDRGAVERDDRPSAFERAADAVVDGRLEELRAMLDEEPSLATARSPRPHRVTLLHYLGANGVESFRQRTPANAVEVMRCLLEAGAEPDALSCTYGGGPAQTTMALLTSSSWPAEAGVQAELVRELVAAGANPNGLDEDGVPLATAIAFRCSQAADGLAETARLDNPIFAAAVGRVDLLEELVESDGRARPGWVHCRVPWLHMSRDPLLVAQQALVAAAAMGRADAVRFLVEQRAVDANGTPFGNRSALHEAAFQGDAELVEFLCERGADPSLREDQFKSSALGWAKEGKHEAVCEVLYRYFEPSLYECAEFRLLDRLRAHLDRDPSLVDAPDGTGGMLRWAAHEGVVEIVELLVERGAKLDAPGVEGKTPLELARAAGHTEVCRLLGG